MMNPAQIAAVASGAGFAGDDLITAVAIALAESNPPGNENSVGDQGTSFGLWQIHIPAHPEFQGLNHLDPQVNAHEAFDVYQTAGDSFRPWSTYSVNAQYRNFMQDAATGVAQLASSMFPQQPPTPPPSGNLGPPEDGGGVLVASDGFSFRSVLILAGVALGALWLVEQAS